MTLLCLLSAVAAFLLFGLSTEAHHARWLGARPPNDRKQTLKLGAWVAVLCCAMLAFAAQGAIFGAVFWLGALSLGAALVFLFLNLCPARPRNP